MITTFGYLNIGIDWYFSVGLPIEIEITFIAAASLLVFYLSELLQIF